MVTMPWTTPAMGLPDAEPFRDPPLDARRSSELSWRPLTVNDVV